MALSSQYTISIIICTFNRAKDLNRCLESLTRQASKNFEVIIVDAGSTDNTEKIISKYSRQLNIQKLVYPEQSLSKTRQLGLVNASAKYVAFVDDDVSVSPEWTKSITNIFQKNKNIGGISGPTIVPQSLLKNRDVFFFHQNNSFFAKFYRYFFLENQPYAVGKLFKCGAWSPGSNFTSCLKIKDLANVDYLEACNMVLKKDIALKVGGFNDKYNKTSEWCELDLAIRVKNLGYRLVFTPRVKVNHYLSRRGAYPRRGSVIPRAVNFLRFYFTHVFKPTPVYFFKFLCYLIFLICYALYKMFRHHR